jgi:voltage-gated potassium channel
MNIYLAVYCRRLNPELRIISRITHEKNIEAIYRAGADFAISYASLGVEEVFAQLHSRELLNSRRRIRAVFGAGSAIAGGPDLEASKLTATELFVIGMQQNGRVVTNPTPSTRLTEGTELYIMGGTRGREAFIRASGRETKR